MGITFKEKSKHFKRAVARYGLFVFAWLFKLLPYVVVRFLGNIIIFIGYALVIKQKNVARETLKIAFGEEKLNEELDRIIKSCFNNLGQGMIEMVYALSHPETVNSKVSVEGKQYLEEALKKGKGVIAVTAHFGNFPLMMLYYAVNGYKTNAIIRPTRDPEVEEFLFKKRTELGLNTVYAIPRQQCVTTSLKVLRNNEILFVPLDQNFGSEGGVFVDFFGQKAATATGPIIFANRTEAAILPMFIIREKEEHHKIIIEPQYNLERFEDEKKTILVNTGKITNLIERYIRKYPHEWGWMHRRWKCKPNTGRRNINDKIL